MKSIARISAALLLITVWIIPGFTQAAGPGPSPARDYCAVSTPSKIQQEDEQRRREKPKQPAGEKKSTTSGKTPSGKKAIRSLPDPARSNGASPLDVFSDIESGWKHENVNIILQHFGKGKVSIAIGGIGLAGGRFSKSQSFYLLKDLFKYTLTKKFEFVQFRNVDSGKRRVYAVAERYYKRTDDGRLFKDKIYVSLNFEDEHWVINEIKSIE